MRQERRGPPHMNALFVHWLSPAAVDLSALDIGFFTALVWLDGVVHRARAWVGQIVTFFAYSPPSLPLGSLTPTGVVQVA